MNRGQLRSEVYRRANLSIEDSVVTAGVVNSAIDQANQQIAVDHDWPWLRAKETITTAGGVDLYTPAGDWTRTVSLRAAGRSPMRRADPVDLDTRWTGLEFGIPTEYGVDVDQLLLRPVPDGVYTLTHRYERTPSLLILDTDTPELDARFHAAIVDIAVSLVLRTSREDARAALAMASYENTWRPRMRDETRRFRGPGRLRQRAGEWL